jgi:hypothetical protein
MEGSTDSSFGEAAYADVSRTTYGENKAATLGVFRCNSKFLFSCRLDAKERIESEFKSVSTQETRLMH